MSTISELKPVATISETKLLRDSGLISITPDCKVTFTKILKRANLLKDLRDAANQERLIYRDFRLYAYPPEAPRQSKPKKAARAMSGVRMSSAYAPKIVLEQIPNKEKELKHGNIQNTRISTVKAWVTALPKGAMFTNQDIHNLLGINSHTFQMLCINRPDLKQYLDTMKLIRGRYQKA